MENDGRDDRDSEGILAGDDGDDFERFLEKKVKACGQDATLVEIVDRSSVLDVEDMSWSSGDKQASGTSKPSASGVAPVVGEPVSVTAMSAKTAETLRREAVEHEKQLQVERSKATYEALQRAEKRREELAAIPIAERDAALQLRTEQEIARLQEEPPPSSAVYIEEHASAPKLVAHEVAGHYVVEADGLMEWDEEMKSLYFSDFVTHYHEMPDGSAVGEPLSYEETKSNLENIIKQQHRLTRGIKLIKVKLGAGSAAKVKLLARLSELDRIGMAELDKVEREKYHGRRVAKSGEEKEKKARKAPVSKTGKTPAQKDIDSLLSMSFDEEYIVKHLKGKTNKTTGESFWNEASESYLKLALSRQ